MCPTVSILIAKIGWLVKVFTIFWNSSSYLLNSYFSCFFVQSDLVNIAPRFSNSAFWIQAMTFTDHWVVYDIMELCTPVLFDIVWFALASRLKDNLVEQSVLFWFLYDTIMLQASFILYVNKVWNTDVWHCLPMVIQCTDLKLRLEKSLFTLNDHIFKLLLDYCYVLLNFLSHLFHLYHVDLMHQTHW